MIIPQTLRLFFFTLCALIIFASNAQPMQAENPLQIFSHDDAQRIMQLVQEISKAPQSWDHNTIYDRLTFIADDDVRDTVVEAVKLLQQQFAQSACHEEEPDQEVLHQKLLLALDKAEQQITKCDRIASAIEVTAVCVTTLVILFFIIKLCLANLGPCSGCSHDYYFAGQKR